MTRSWISRLFARSCAARQARSITRRRAKVWPTRFDLELLEDRNAPASFVEAGATLNLNLDTASESVSIQSNGTNYKLSLAATNWSGTDSANVTGNGSNTLTVTKAGIDAFTSGINIADSAAATSVTFATSGAKLYANALNVFLGMGSNGVTFDGASDFDGESLVGKSDGPHLLAGGAAVTTYGGRM